MSIKDLQDSQQPIEVQQLRTRFLQIEEQLVSKTPDLPMALADIHKNLHMHEELVHLLDDDDLSKLHQAFELHKNIALIEKEIKAVKAGGKKKKLSENDLKNL